MERIITRNKEKKRLGKGKGIKLGRGKLGGKRRNWGKWGKRKELGKIGKKWEKLGEKEEIGKK